MWFQHTAARRRLLKAVFFNVAIKSVSTHSRTEAAAFNQTSPIGRGRSFNTQPHGGGCLLQKHP